MPDAFPVVPMVGMVNGRWDEYRHRRRHGDMNIGGEIAASRMLDSAPAQLPLGQLIVIEGVEIKPLDPLWETLRLYLASMLLWSPRFTLNCSTPN